MQLFRTGTTPREVSSGRRREDIETSWHLPKTRVARKGILFLVLATHLWHPVIPRVERTDAEELESDII